MEIVKKKLVNKSFGGFIISSSGANVEQSRGPWIAEPQARCHERLGACPVGSATGKSAGKLKQFGSSWP